MTRHEPTGPGPDVDEPAAEHVRPSAPPDRRQAQQVLITMGRLGQLVSDTIRKSVDAELSGNAEVIVITDLDLRGPLRPSEIVSLTGMTSGGVTKLLDRLERGGYITRSLGAIPADRRATVLALTPKGQKLAAVYADALLAVNVEVREFASMLRAVLPDEVPRDPEAREGHSPSR